jgi:F-box protein 18 (helicase)
MKKINLLYVAVTRAKNHLYIPEELVPEGFSVHPNIHILKEEIFEIEFAKKDTKNKNSAAYMPWTDDLDDELMNMYHDNLPIKTLAEHFGRSYGAIKARIEKLEDIDYF